MKKSQLFFAAISMALVAQPVFAAKFAKVSTLANPQLQSLSLVAHASDAITGEASYAVIVPTPAQGRDPQTVRMQTLKQAMVMGVCGFFDDAINLSPAVSADNAMSALGQYSDGSDADLSPITNALQVAMQGPGLEVFGGDAGGNNTVGAVVGIYDLFNNQVLVFGSSNCGSDD